MVQRDGLAGYLDDCVELNRVEDMCILWIGMFDSSLKAVKVEQTAL